MTQILNLRHIELIDASFIQDRGDFLQGPGLCK